MPSNKINSLERLSKKLYTHHVPQVLQNIVMEVSNILTNAQIVSLKSEFKSATKFLRLFVGSDHRFRSRKFHDLCDNKGPTISICKSNTNAIFGLYTSIAWEKPPAGCLSSYKNSNGRAFLFKLEQSGGGGNGLVTFESKGKAHAYHSRIYMTNDYGGF